MAADVFAIVSLAMPDWIITDVGGDTRLGLMWTCMTLYDRPQVCFTPDLQPEWLLALVCIFVGCICITTTIILLASSHWDRNVVPYARWVGFTAMVLFCLAAVIFPMGFHVDEIGGQPYQLPNSHQVGISYILFVLALWITVISELFAGKVCLPHFWCQKSMCPAYWSSVLSLLFFFFDFSLYFCLLYFIETCTLGVYVNVCVSVRGCVLYLHNLLLLWYDVKYAISNVFLGVTLLLVLTSIILMKIHCGKNTRL